MLVNVQTAYEKGLHDFASLHEHERLLFILLDFETLMDMEGWDHFFIYEHHFALYAELKDWLLKIDDQLSLAVLQGFERHLQERNVQLGRDSYEAYFGSMNDHERISSPDWRKDYSDVSEQRWSKVTDFLAGQGLVLG